MSFTPDEIEAMSPAIREEIQEACLVWHFARRRRQLYAEQHKRGHGWPHAWHSRNDDPLQAHLAKIDRQEWAALHQRRGSKESNGG